MILDGINRQGQPRQDGRVWASLGHCKDGRPILILTNSTANGHVFANSTSPSIFDRAADPIDQKVKNLISPPPPPEQLPEDLEGIDVDPNVQCDVVAVIKYEQNLGRELVAPKLEPILETV